MSTATMAGRGSANTSAKPGTTAMRTSPPAGRARATTHPAGQPSTPASHVMSGLSSRETSILRSPVRPGQSNKRNQHPGPTMTDRPAGSVDPKLLEILVCPLTKSTLEYDADKQELISRAAKLAYPIRDGIPIMLPEEARRLD